ncbi:MAG: MacB family efflux pump subunit [Proteobacteria bacterium]|jgi:macrolide transport system ATP-binding/permease protein|nr:MacB family efflux pump subunit [Alphaproteobacteria bacterium]NCC03756.1 MacB family efflux pump subunit [Pseudomonadota bacterium]
MTEPVADGPIIRLSHISRHYAAGEALVRALDDVSLDIHAGEFVAIMGQSGSGKTTLMNILGCLDRPTNGEYWIEGREVSGYDRDEQAHLRSRMFGFIFQRYNLLDVASAQENVELPAIYAGMTKEQRAARAFDLLGRLGIAERKDNRPNAMSGGQQQRVAIARALVNDPSIILADEPTGALDSKSGEEVMALLHELNAEGRTIILITHDKKVASYARRQITLADGKLISDTGTQRAEAESKRRTRDTDNATGVTDDMREAIKMALRALHVNKFRTFLTLLGIIIGVASVVAMLAIGDGSKQKVLDQITKMGTNLLMIRPGAPGIRPSAELSTLTVEDATAIAQIDNIRAAIPERNGNFTVRYGDVDDSVNVTGTNQDKPIVNDWPVAEGSGMTEMDYRRMATVAMIGQTVKKNFFPHGEDPIGKLIIIKNVPFEIIGVMSEKGASPFGSDMDNVIFIPLSTGLVRLFGRTFISTIVAQADDLSKIDETEKAIHGLLLERHRKEDFSVRNSASYIQMATETQNTLKILLGAVAAISLLVGGIGVMNIMLVSVTERTREIGLRMATGARTRDILLQFVTEAIVVCLIGGLLGVALGVGIALVVDAFGTRTILSLAPIMMAFGCAVSTGLLFGYLPARKAAHMDPVAALASE